MRIVVVFVSAVLLALQLAPTSALVIRPRRELPDRFSKILQRVKKDAVVDDSSSTGEELKKCTRDEDCKRGKVCIQPDPIIWDLRDPQLGPTFCLRLCPPLYFTSQWTPNCHRPDDPRLEPPPGHEGYSCQAAADCKYDQCCGYHEDFQDQSFRFCKPFVKEGEPCVYHVMTTTTVMPWPSMLFERRVRKKRQLHGGDCCEPGLHCSKEGVCIADEDRAHDTEEAEEISKPPEEDGKTDDNPEKTDDISEEIPNIPDATEAKPDEKDDDIENLDSTQIEELDAEDHPLK